MAAQADGWTSALRGGVGRQSRSAMAQNHVDVDALLEDYAWKHFKDIQSLRKTRLDDFKNLEREDVEFVLVCELLLFFCLRFIYFSLNFSIE